jgi:hypothetical protein
MAQAKWGIADKHLGRFGCQPNPTYRAWLLGNSG